MGGWFDYDGKQKGYKPMEVTRASFKKNIGSEIVFIRAGHDCDKRRGTFFPRFGKIKSIRYNYVSLDNGYEFDIRDLVDCGIKISDDKSGETK